MSAPRWGTALVTGASSGIGREFARRLAADGSDLVLVARRRDRLDELAEQLHGDHGTAVEVLPADLTDPEERGRVEKRLTETDPGIDLLINNAGVPLSGRFSRVDVDRHDALVRLNVLAVVRLTHAALGAMVDRGRGGIINVSSMAGFQALPREATYAASKAFVTNFTEAVAEEVRGTGVHVLALCPGFVRTEFHPDEEIERSPLPSRIWMDPQPVVDAALKSLRRGQVICVPGGGYKVARVVSEATPRSVVRRVLGKATSQKGGRR
jgi:uncharacterized protein